MLSANKVKNFQDFPYSCSIRCPVDHCVFQWAEGTIGKRFEKWFAFYGESFIITFCFKDEQDLLMFKLVWQ
jgi:hypothetical protein